MGYQNDNTIINKFNDAIYELTMLFRAERNDDLESVKRHKSNAGRTLYECLEGALKNHISQNGDGQAKNNLQYNSDRKKLFDDFVAHKTPLEDDFDDNIEYSFLLGQGRLINEEKHQLADVVMTEDLQKFQVHLRKIISGYISNKPLKEIKDFEKIDLPS